jgi:hypothetical protein
MRESATVYRGIPLVVELHPSFLRLRQKRKRQYIDIEYAVCLEAAYRLQYLQAQREKKAEKKGTPKKKKR